MLNKVGCVNAVAKCVTGRGRDLTAPMVMQSAAGVMTEVGLERIR